MKKTLSMAAAAVLLASALAGCSNNDNGNEAANPTVTPAASSTTVPTASIDANAEARLDVDQTSYSLMQWKMDNSHVVTNGGKLMIGDLPVANAILHIGDSQRDIATAEDGSFSMLIDQSLLSEVPVRVVSLDNATIGGQPIGQDIASKLLETTTYISVYYPIRTTKVEPSAKDPSMVEVYGQVQGQTGDELSFFQIDKYRIGGIVKDPQGNPVKNAVVWIDRDEGEGFAKSTPTDDAGRYYLYYLPESDEGTNFSVVTEDNTRYTLPKGKVFHIPDGTSVDINVTLPSEGTEIVDKPPTLEAVTSPGAMYTGILVGLNLPADVSYDVTIPNRDGTFKLTVPKDAWEQHPSFFETKLTKFVDDMELEEGDTLPSSFFQPGANDPKNIVAESL